MGGEPAKGMQLEFFHRICAAPPSGRLARRTVESGWGAECELYLEPGREPMRLLIGQLKLRNYRPAGRTATAYRTALADHVAHLPN